MFGKPDELTDCLSAIDLVSGLGWFLIDLLLRMLMLLSSLMRVYWILGSNTGLTLSSY